MIQIACQGCRKTGDIVVPRECEGVGILRILEFGYEEL